MSTLSQAQIYADALKVGFSAEQAKTMAAIAEAESGGNPSAVGDVGLQNSTWGPSVGLTQVRTIKAQTGTGNVRDINTLTDPLGNLKAAYDISNHGTNWQPWSTYNSGAYKQYLGNSVTSTGAQNAGWTDTLKNGIDKGLQTVIPGYAAGEQAVQGAQSLTSMLTDKSFWLRVGFVAMGLLIILIAVSKSIGSVTPSLPQSGGSNGPQWVEDSEADPEPTEDAPEPFNTSKPSFASAPGNSKDSTRKSAGRHVAKDATAIAE